MASKRVVAMVAACLAASALVAQGCRKQNENAERAGNEAEAPDSGSPSEVTLTPAQVKLAEIRSEPAKVGDVAVELAMTGEISLNMDRVVHVVPRVPGIVKSVKKTLGDQVDYGTTLAVIESKELAEAKAICIGTFDKIALAQSHFDREERLWKGKISPEKDFLDAKQALAEARIESNLACQKLQALGFSREYAEGLRPESHATAAEFEIASPLAGTIIEKRFAPGEHVGESDLYTIANLDQLWLIADVYEKDIARITKGQAGRIAVRAYVDQEFEGTLTWISDTIDEETRTLKVRIEVENKKHLLKPGMFARVLLTTDSRKAALSVPAGALQAEGEQTIVFVDLGGGRFERREVKLGVRSKDAAEVLDGIKAGELIVTTGSFSLKSELAKAGFEED